MPAGDLSSATFRELLDAVRTPRQAWKRPTSLGELARRCGISRSMLYAMMRGTQVPSSSTIALVARGLKRPVAEVAAAVHASRLARIAIACASPEDAE